MAVPRTIPSWSGQQTSYESNRRPRIRVPARISPESVPELVDAVLKIGRAARNTIAAASSRSQGRGSRKSSVPEEEALAKLGLLRSYVLMDGERPISCIRGCQFDQTPNRSRCPTRSKCLQPIPDQRGVRLATAKRSPSAAWSRDHFRLPPGKSTSRVRARPGEGNPLRRRKQIGRGPRLPARSGAVCTRTGEVRTRGEGCPEHSRSRRRSRTNKREGVRR